MNSAYHCQEYTELGVEVDTISVGEDELLLTFFLGRQNDSDLLGSYRQHGQVNTVELVEASP